MAAVGEGLLLRIDGETDPAIRALDRLDKSIAKTQRLIAQESAQMAAASEAAARKQAAAFDHMGNILLGVGTAAAAGLGLATREAMQWESAWAGVTKTVSGSTSEMDALEQGLRDMALTLPATHEEIAGVAAAAGALGIEGPNILKFTKTMIDLGQATDDLDAQTAATALAQFMNVVGTGQEDVDRLGASLVALGNNGASTEGQILEMAQRLAAAGKIAKFSEGDILGFASALTSVGIEAEAGGSAFSKVFIGIDDAVKTGNATLQTFATVAGMSASQFSTAFREDAAGATTAFVEGLGRLDASGASLTGTLDELGLSDIRVKNALLSSAGAGDLMREAVELGNDAWVENSALLNEVAKRYDTTEAKVAMARNALVDAGIDIGSQLLPVLATLAGSLSDLVGWFTDLPGWVKSSATALAGIVAVGGLLVGAGLKIQGAIARVNTSLAATPKLAGAASASLGAIGKASMVAGVVFGLGQITTALSNIFDPSFDTEKLAGDLARLGASGKMTGTLLKITGGDMADLIHDLQMTAENSVWDKGFLGFPAAEFVRNAQAIDEALSSMDPADSAAAFAEIADAWVRQGGSMTELMKILPEYGDALRTGRVDAEILNDEQARGADIVEDLTPAQQALADQFGLTGQAAKDAADELSAMDDALHAIYDTMFGTEAAQDATAQGWIDMRDSITDMKDRYAEAMAVLSDPEATDEAKAAAQGLIDTYGTFTGTLTGNSAEALANRDAIREQLQSYLDQIDTLDEVTLGSEEYKAQVEALKDEFIKNATEAGYAEDGVLNYAAAFDAVPTNVPTAIEQPGMDVALRNTQYLSDKLAALQGTTTHTVHVEFDWDEGWFSAPPGGGGSSGAQGAGAPAGDGGRTGSGSSGSGFGEQSWGAGGAVFGDQSATERGSAFGALSMPAYIEGDGGRSGGAKAGPINVDARTINNFPFRRESPEDHMRSLSRVSALGVLAHVGGPALIGAVESS